MPSIPQSLLWISLVVLWLFVLVPMLISKREAVRRTSDVALATRVLNGAAASRLLKRRGGPAAGHQSDPDWQADEHADSDFSDEHDEDDDAPTDQLRRARPLVMAVARDAEPSEPDYLDVDVVEDSSALPPGESVRLGEPKLVAEPDPVDDAVEEPAEESTEPEVEAELRDDEYEYVDDSSGLEPPDDGAEDDGPVPFTPGVSRRRRFDNKTAAVVSARKYRFRRRVLMAMAVVLVGSAITAFEVTPSAWWVCGTATAVTLMYLGYLRRQTRIEEQVRRRRMQRMARARLGVENAYDRDYDVVPARLRRPGAVVLEIDDEDPIFEHLDYAMPVRNYGWPRDLPRAVGQ
ncbi:hypothetical protein BST27_26335 [Mycobacterium intermedium]|uniref:Transmembrane protein n=1 Tax=Mycobacterium intermedium TaxID=28445 RepID=A0A1E3SIL8_MYCIE|nr:gephyrin-like molybdotransferase receptor GlpR [Mycobacterium intermedium]MCV6963288.1 hypothetical protein [Mycobacterium intermedium]ODR01503.1 hypothetical protein BHQ20_08425 [Mycobacterium intermedium]OPE47440.1 hypothetical protein BV508_21940 [Mycobacterium intermedium]ORA95970.1 hypothetical protein BST27_26335 [Mycobacterium intermedium]